DPELMFRPWAPIDPRVPPLDVDSDVPPWLSGEVLNGEEPAWPVLIAWLPKDVNGRYHVDDTQTLPRVRILAAALESCSVTSPPEPPNAPLPEPLPPVPNARVDLARQMGGGHRLFAVRTANRLGAATDRLRIELDGRTTFDGNVTWTAPSDSVATRDLILAD